MKSLIFFCPKCDCRQTLEEVMVDVTVGSTISHIHPDGECEYGEQANEDGHIERFQCAKCGFILREEGGSPVTEYEELAEWLREHSPPTPDNCVTHRELVQRFADGLATFDGEEFADFWNNANHDQVRYVGDSMYEWVEEKK